jgi:hypothetical protein
MLSTGTALNYLTTCLILTLLYHFLQNKTLITAYIFDLK